ncbi:MAG: hypothetical protein ACK4RK_09835 [Gemmataceae bacterium]
MSESRGPIIQNFIVHPLPPCAEGDTQRRFTRADDFLNPHGAQWRSDSP